MEISKKLEEIEDFLNNGDDLTLPIRNISFIVENLQTICDKQEEDLKKIKYEINKINSESIKARNQIVYMFLVILATLVGKFIIRYLIG